LKVGPGWERARSHPGYVLAISIKMCGPALRGVHPQYLPMIANTRSQDLSLIPRPSPALFPWPQYPKTYTEVKIWCHTELDKRFTEVSGYDVILSRL